MLDNIVVLIFLVAITIFGCWLVEENENNKQAIITNLNNAQVYKVKRYHISNEGVSFKIDGVDYILSSYKLEEIK